MRIDRRLLRRIMAALAAAIVVGAAVPASAIIKVDFPVSRLYKQADVVAVAEVARVNAGAVECTVRERLKGRLRDATLTVDAPAELARALKAGEPVVVFIAGDRAILHAADAWHRADRKPGPRWAVTGSYPMIRNYPGRTVGLVDIVHELKAERRGIQDGIGHEFVGALVDRANLGVTPTFLTTADVDGDGDLDLIVGTAKDVRLFTADHDRYADVTDRWGLKDATGKSGAAGDVNADGHVDLLLGNALWLGRKDRFVKSNVVLALGAEETWAAAALADADGDKRTDAVVLSRSGELKTALNTGRDVGVWPVKSSLLWPRGRDARAALFSRDWGDDGAWYVLVVHADDIVRYPVGAATAPDSDFKRLTGITLAEYPKIGPTPLEVDLCTALDYDGNGLEDLLVVTRGGGVTLANRGYGAMIINGFMHTQFRSSSDWKGGPKIPKVPFDISPSVCVAPGKRAGRTGKGHAQNLFLLRADGQLFEMINDRR